MYILSKFRYYISGANPNRMTTNRHKGATMVQANTYDARNELKGVKEDLNTMRLDKEQSMIE